MQRSDVVLAELDDFLQAQDCSQNRIILAVASEASSLLPCCKQSLGFKNAQISKLWSASHWKTDSCRIYWKDTHLVCVRKYRPNSTYASVEEVKGLVGDAYEYLHEMPSALSPLRRVSSKPVLGARSPTIVTSNATRRTLRTVSSYSKLSGTTPRTSDDHPSPTQRPAVSRASAKPRASEPAISARMPSVRSPIITRRRSNTALHALKSSPSPQPPIPTRPASSARSPPAVQSLVRKASDSALALKARGRVSTGAARSVSGSAIPTPVRRASVNLLDSIAHGSPGSPIEHSKALRASLRHAKTTSTTVSVSVQTELESNPLMEEFIKLEEEYNRLKGEHETTLAYTRELGLENQKLRKQKNGVMEESEKLKEKKKVLEGTIKELKETNASLIDENGWIVVCKTEQEEKTKQLETENEKLASQYTILSNQRKELELNDALDEISRLQVQAAAARMTARPMQPVSTPMKTPISRFKEALDPVTVYRTPYLTPVKQGPVVTATGQMITTPTTRMTPRSKPKIGSISARKVRTPLAGQKHGIGFWKRMAKRRMFA